MHVGRVPPCYNMGPAFKGPRVQPHWARNGCRETPRPSLQATSQLILPSPRSRHRRSTPPAEESRVNGLSPQTLMTSPLGTLPACRGARAASQGPGQLRPQEHTLNRAPSSDSRTAGMLPGCRTQRSQSHEGNDQPWSSAPRSEAVCCRARGD